MKFNVRLTMQPTNRILAKRNLEAGGKVQQYIDSEVLRRNSPLVPYDTGQLERSGTQATKLGSGQVRYNTPYARKQYYENRGKGNRGRLWFERMKAKDKKSILEGAAKVAGGKAK